MGNFKGWIPTLTGRLSYDAFGRTVHPTRCYWASCGYGPNRVFVCHQKRCGKDGLLPGIFFRIFKNTDPSLIFMASSRVTEKDTLKGYTYIFSLKNNPSGIPWVNIKKKFDCNDPESPGLLQKVAEEKLIDPSSWWIDYLKTYHSYARENCLNFVEFEITRDGECALTAIDKEVLQELGSKNKIFEYQEEDFFTEEEGEHELMTQYYMFLKDIGHAHQHHAETDDQVTLLYQFSNSSKYEWIEDTARHLFRYVIDAKRNRNSSYGLSSLGVLAYLESLLRIYEKRKNNEPEVNGNTLSPYPWLDGLHGFDQLEKSIHIKNDEIRFKKERRLRLITHFFTPFIALMGLLFSLTIIYKFTLNSGVPLKAHPSISFFGEIVTSYFPFVCGIFVLLTSLFVFAVEGGDLLSSAFRGKIKSVFLGPIRLLLPFPKPVTQSVTLILSLILIIWGLLILFNL